uniref:NADH dehydrogenase subunit 11 n=1 Tax=Seculamonas ecuadoriensis TaxID=221724 RepID=M4QB08_SECEC|nr:NADH dehydrogenase subunit 11 [Seculamonas ecuadoriensis]AGH24491.1 NADH dehydrogenase subunit 11 [Seculamonas ecuadoriensis]
MVLVTIDGQSIDVGKGSTILQACAKIGVEIPRFCYHERLSIAGNCRMCLVEVEKSPKPVASCAMPVLEGMKIHTTTPLVKKAREGVLEFLLVNHPLDCPICDQGGECDLQDLTMIYGSDRGRFHEYKRSVEDKNLGPLVKTIMTRCIHCTRCVRFATEIAGVQDLGTIGRGRDTEISTYIQKLFNSELSGNVIDLCPVGALTSKPYAFTARAWELKSTESIDVSDAVGSNIRIDLRGSEIMRVLPRLNEDVNEEWISDKARFSYDGLKRQRLHNPMIKINGEYKSVDWKEAFNHIKNSIKTVSSSEMVAIIGNQADVESTLMLKELLAKLGSDNIYLESMLKPGSENQKVSLNNDFRSNYTLNMSLKDIGDADLCLLVGTNPRLEAPIVNLRLRKRFLQGGFKVSSIGPVSNLTYPCEHLGNNVNVLLEIAEGRHAYSKLIAKAKKPIILVGMSALQRFDSNAIMNMIHTINKHTKATLGIVHAHASTVGGLDLGIKSKSQINKHKFIFLLGVDNKVDAVHSESFVVYQGHHGDAGAHLADVILPGAAYTEKTAHYVNLEGRSQISRMAFFSPGNSREDWRIIRALSEELGVTLPYHNDADVQRRLKDVAPHITEHGSIVKQMTPFVISHIEKFTDQPFERYIDNFYLTDAVCRSSQIMARCSTLYKLD